MSARLRLAAFAAILAASLAAGYGIGQAFDAEPKTPSSRHPLQQGLHQGGH